jgi:hypothetical protein
MSTMSDADLLLRVRARDRDAMAALYDRHAARMYAIALRSNGSREIASQILEEAFAALAAGAAPEGAGESWLLRLVRDLAVARESQMPAPRVEGMTPTPRSLVEEAFYRGAGVAKLSQAYGLPETDIRKMIADGIRQLRA